MQPSVRATAVSFAPDGSAGSLRGRPSVPLDVSRIEQQLPRLPAKAGPFADATCCVIADRVTSKGKLKRGLLVALNYQHLAVCSESGEVQRLVPLHAVETVTVGDTASGGIPQVLLRCSAAAAGSREPDLLLNIPPNDRNPADAAEKLVDTLCRTRKLVFGRDTQVRRTGGAVGSQAQMLQGRRTEGYLQPSQKMQQWQAAHEREESPGRVAQMPPRAPLTSTVAESAPPPAAEPAEPPPEPTPPARPAERRSPTGPGPITPPATFAIVHSSGCELRCGAGRDGAVAVLAAAGNGDVWVLETSQKASAAGRSSTGALRHAESGLHLAAGPPGRSVAHPQACLAAEPQAALWEPLSDGTLWEVSRDPAAALCALHGAVGAPVVLRSEVDDLADAAAAGLLWRLQPRDPPAAPPTPEAPPTPQPAATCRSAAAPPTVARSRSPGSVSARGDLRRLRWLERGFEDFFSRHDPPRCREAAAEAAEACGNEQQAYRQMLASYPRVPLNDLAWLLHPPPIGPPDSTSVRRSPPPEVASAAAELAALQREESPGRVAQMPPRAPLTSTVAESAPPPAAEPAEPPPEPTPPARPAERRSPTGPGPITPPATFAIVHSSGCELRCGAGRDGAVAVLAAAGNGDVWVLETSQKASAAGRSSTGALRHAESGLHLAAGPPGRSVAHPQACLAAEPQAALWEPLSDGTLWEVSRDPAAALCALHGAVGAPVVLRSEVDDLADAAAAGLLWRLQPRDPPAAPPTPEAPPTPQPAATCRSAAAPPTVARSRSPGSVSARGDLRRLRWLERGFEDFFSRHDPPRCREAAAEAAEACGNEQQAYRQMLASYPRVPLNDLAWLLHPPPIGPPDSTSVRRSPPPEVASAAAELAALQREVQALSALLLERITVPPAPAPSENAASRQACAAHSIRSPHCGGLVSPAEDSCKPPGSVSPPPVTRISPAPPADSTWEQRAGEQTRMLRRLVELQHRAAETGGASPQRRADAANHQLQVLSEQLRLLREVADHPMQQRADVPPQHQDQLRELRRLQQLPPQQQQVWQGFSQQPSGGASPARAQMHAEDSSPPRSPARSAVRWVTHKQGAVVTAPVREINGRGDVVPRSTPPPPQLTPAQAPSAAAGSAWAGDGTAGSFSSI
eukprot:TRINITY_DN4570_c0_g1_i1.p1 TRINITY_DN4570_c0_g1~~TRINITY_DN4570_c0_g1_i1.p1  ORF type:complete len:1140 (+),score=191.36 TRINITY_DN4570_c0_g1_i1:95-3514(+)